MLVIAVIKYLTWLTMIPKSPVPYPEITTYTGADALAILHRIRCKREVAECLFCTLISGANRTIRVKPEKRNT